MSDLAFIGIALVAVVVWHCVLVVRRARREERTVKAVVLGQRRRAKRYEDLDISIVARGAWKASLAAAYTQGPSAVVIHVRELLLLLLGVGLVAGTLVLVSIDVLAGQIAAAVAVLLLGYGVPSRAGSRGVHRLNLALRALAIVPLATVIATAMLHPDVSVIASMIVVALVVCWLVWRMAPVLEVGRASLFAFPLQPVPLTVGYVLSIVAYLAGAPVLVARGASTGTIVAAVLGAAAAGLAEELVFRGVLQRNLQRAAARVGVLLGAGVFACGYLGFHSAALVLVMLVAGILFGNSVLRTGATGSVALGHVLLGVGACVVWPLILGRDRPSWVDETVLVVVLAAAAMLATGLLFRGRGASLVVRRGAAAAGRHGAPAREHEREREVEEDWFADAPRPR